MKKRMIFVLSGIAVFVVGCAIGGHYVYGYYSRVPQVTAIDRLSTEYGVVVSMEDLYVKTDAPLVQIVNAKWTNTDSLEEPKISDNSNNVSIGNNVGQAEVTIEATGKNGKTNSKIVLLDVRDTTAPDLNICKEYVIEAGDTKPDLKENLFAKDCIDGDLTNKVVINDSGVNYGKPGQYEIAYKVSDSSNNTTEDKASITVNKAKPHAVEIDNQEICLAAEESAVLSAKVENDNWIGEVVWSSSDENVVSVDSSGNVKWVGEGTAVIQATAEEVSDSCVITCDKKPEPVVEKPKESKPPVLDASTKQGRLAIAKADAKTIKNSIIYDGMSDYDKAYAIFCWVASNCCVQDDQSTESYKYNYGNEAYAVFELHIAACSGYAKAVTLLCDEAGLQSTHANAGLWTHQWNYIYGSDGTKYYCDAQGCMFGIGDYPYSGWFGEVYK